MARSRTAGRHLNTRCGVPAPGYTKPPACSFRSAESISAESISVGHSTRWPSGGMLPGGKPKTRTHSSGVASRACRRATPKWDAIARRSARSVPRRSATTGSHVFLPFEPPFEPPLPPPPPSFPDAPSALATGSRPRAVVSPATITPMLLTTASGAIPSPRADAVSLAAGPVSTASSITVGSPPALGNRSASAAATSAGVIGATASSSPSFSVTRIDGGLAIRTVALAIRTVASSTSPMISAAGLASSNARSAASARADGSRARLFPNSKPGMIRSKTLASCAPYATCDSVSGRLDQSPHRSRLSSGCPSKAWHTEDSPGCDP